MILTDEIVKDFLQYLYHNDYRYLFRVESNNSIVVSKGEPLFSKGRHIESMPFYDELIGYSSKLGKAILNDEGHCIDIGKKLNIIDWSTVKVDTKILVRNTNGDEWKKRYFARYVNEKVYAFDSGKTSWSADANHLSDLVPWEFAEVVEE